MPGHFNTKMHSPH